MRPVRTLIAVRDLESRVVPAVYTVTTISDAGGGSLRQAVSSANANPGTDTINFDALFNAQQTIFLTSGSISVTGSLTITGPELTRVVVNGNASSRHFTVDGTGVLNFKLENINLTNGNATGINYGGSLFVRNEAMVLTNCDLTSNQSAQEGGAIYLDNNASLVATNCRFLSNQSITSGGAIRANSSNAVNMTGCTIQSNIAGFAGQGAVGGAIRVSSGSLTIENSCFSDNTSTEWGGAIDIGGTFPAPIVIRNSTISGNAAGFRGGAISLRFTYGNLLVQNSTITSNNGGTGNGGIYRTAGNSQVMLESTTVAQNTGSSATDISSSGGVSGTNSLIGISGAGSGHNLSGTGNKTGTLAAPLDAKLSALTNNGGTTLTHALLPGSPCIDAGYNPQSLVFDQRGQGFVRMFASAADIGSFESQLTAKVSHSTINGAESQRSKVTSLTVTFDQVITFSGSVASAFNLRHSVNDAVVNLAATVNNTSTSTAVTLSFISGSVDGSSLADGRYTLTALASQVNNGNFDGNGDGTPGDNYTLIGTPVNGLFRLFGDADGDGTVAANDFIQFRLALGGTNSTFDFDNDGSVSASDFIQFRLRFGGSI